MRTAALAAGVVRGLAGNNAAGLVVRVERRGALLLEEAWGLSVDLPRRRVPMTPACRFDLASVTKLFTTTAALRLSTLGRLDLDATLVDLEPTRTLAQGRPVLADAFPRISVRSLMTHSSGLHYWYPFYAAKACRPEGGPTSASSVGAPSMVEASFVSRALESDFADILEEILTRFPLVPGVVYSDLNYILLGKLVEAAAGLPLERAIQDLVAAPLSLDATGYRPLRGPFVATEFGNRIEEGMVAELGLSFGAWRGRAFPLEGQPDDGNCHYYFGDVAGHAGLFSTVRDACALGNLFLDANSCDGFIAPDLAAEARRDHGGGRGLGFQLGDLYPEGGFGHTGFTGTYLYLNRERGLSVAIFANRLHVERPKNINEWRKELIGTILA